MGDLAAAVFILVLVIGIIFAAVVYHNKQVRLRGNRRISKQICVYAEHGGESPLCLGKVFTDDPEFTYKIEEIRAHAREQVAALNSSTPGWKVSEHSN